jgi:nicotinate-nucleotide pyrophosphorylase (carboxylating)
MVNKRLIDELIEIAIAEDIGDGDHTSFSCLSQDKIGKANLIVKDNGILAGIEIAEKVFHKIDTRLEMDVKLKDGTRVKNGDIAFIVSGPQISILFAERLVLNFMQRMSGIATQTNIYTQKLQGLKTKVLDTRKTTPGLRLIEKMAVKIGGGENHRIGLFDMIMIKDNHIDFSESLEEAISKVENYLQKKSLDLKIVIEARNIKDVEKIMQIGRINRILLDNFTIEQTKEAVNIINGKYEIESSGGINLNNIREYAECGVDYISIGALTHQVQSLDMSLKAI